MRIAAARSARWRALDVGLGRDFAAGFGQQSQATGDVGTGKALLGLAQMNLVALGEDCQLAAGLDMEGGAQVLGDDDLALARNADGFHTGFSRK